MWSPPMWTLCSGLRACTSNSRGALATCSSTKSGSSLTVVALDLLAGLREHVDAPPAAMNSTPSSRDDPPPAAVERRDRVLGQDLVARHPVDEHLASCWSARLTGRAVCVACVEQVFHIDGPKRNATGTQAIDRAAQLLVLVVESETPTQRGRAEPRPAACPRAPSRGWSRRSSARAWCSATATAAASAPARCCCGWPAAASADGRHRRRSATPRMRRGWARPAARRSTWPCRCPAASSTTWPRSTAATSSAPPTGSGAALPHHCTAVGKVLIAFGAARMPRGPLER